MENLKDYGYYKVLTTDSSEKHYIMNDVAYTEVEFMKKLFGEHFMSSENKGEKVQYEGMGDTCRNGKEWDKCNCC